MARDPYSEQRAPAASDPRSGQAPSVASGPRRIRSGSASEPTRIRITRSRVLASVAFVLISIALLYFVLPKLLGLKQTWERIQHGDAWWLGAGAVLEVCSFVGYVMLFRAVFARGYSRIGWRESYQITMAGVAATRLLASAGAGGIALTAWAVRRSGMEARVVACRLVAFMALLYGVYMAALVVCGVGLYLGPIPGSAPFGITVGPAIFGAIVIALFLGIALLPSRSEQRLGRFTSGSGRMARIARFVAAAPATTGSGVRTALALIRSRNPQLLGAVAWWGFDIAVLWACFHAFGASPPKGEIVMAYFVGMLGNTLPLPGGIGGVDGGMIGAFTAFGAPLQVTIVSVLAYRVFAFWLPTVPGAVAYLQLRRTVQRWRATPGLRAAGDASIGEPSYTL